MWMVRCFSAQRQLEAAQAVLKQYDAAADKFIAKVETGRARSVETYNDLKLAREASKELK